MNADKRVEQRINRRLSLTRLTHLVLAYLTWWGRRGEEGLSGEAGAPSLEKARVLVLNARLPS